VAKPGTARNLLADLGVAGLSHLTVMEYCHQRVLSSTLRGQIIFWPLPLQIPILFGGMKCGKQAVEEYSQENAIHRSIFWAHYLIRGLSEIFCRFFRNVLPGLPHVMYC
jgi:hypothetical protein